MNRNSAFVLIFLNTALADLHDVQQISSLCQQQIKNLDSKILFQMFDASAKSPNGILYLNMYQLGNFDECYNIVNGTIYGKYCLGTVGNKSSNLMKMHFGICVPSGCTSRDLETVVPISHFSEDLCYSKTKEVEFSSGAVITLAVLGVFLAAVAVATLYDLLAEKSPQIVLAFSALYNGRKLLKPSLNQDQLSCLYGIKAISMMWVILGHVYINSSEGPLGDFLDIEKWQHRVLNMVIVNATVSVDSFFTVGGLVTVYTFLKTMENRTKFNIFQYYLHRYLRLTPSLAVMVLLHATVLTHLGNGPFWNTIDEKFAKPCQDYWWSALLYIQNYFHGNGTCVPQSWYLSVDFQLFLLSPIILVPLRHHPKVSITLLGVLVPLSCLIPFIVGYVYELPAFISDLETDPTEMMWRYYKQTYTRFGPYVIGMITGYIVYKWRRKQSSLTLSSGAVISIWLLSLGGLLACIYAPYYASLSYNVWSHSLLLAFLRNAWAVGLCGVIFGCVSGYGGVIDWFLSLPIFQFLTKLSYSMYLVHFSVITVRYVSMKHIFLLTNEYMLWSFWGDFAVTLVLSLILTLTFESPIIILERLVFGNGKVFPVSNNRKLDV